MVKKYRSLSKEFKFRIVEGYFHGKKFQRELGGEYGLHPAMISR
jgi:transposase-like protein